MSDSVKATIDLQNTMKPKHCFARIVQMVLLGNSYPHPKLELNPIRSEKKRHKPAYAIKPRHFPIFASPSALGGIF
jgi:hypothetical protein